MAKPIPDGFTSVTPVFTFKDCRKAIEFYKQAFGAQELFAMPGPDGKGVMHAELKIGNSIVMMGEEHPEMSCKGVETFGGSPLNLYLYVENVDQAFRRALEAGAKQLMAVEDMFWGDRTGTVQDLFGYRWTLATHIKDLTPEELQQGAKDAFAKMSTMSNI
jgi:PhnB protein